MDEVGYRQAEQRLWASVGVTPTERRIALERCRTTVRIQEAGEGAPTLLIHGGPNSGSTWAPLVPHLTGARCIILDRPGTGLSDPLAEPLTIERAPEVVAAMVEDVLDALELERADIVASSFGGYAAIHVAASAPDRVGRTVQMGCPALVPGMATPSFMRMMAFRPIRWLMGVLPPNERSARSVMRQIGHATALDDGRMPDELIAWYVALQKHTDTMANEVAMIASAVSRRGFTPEAFITESLLAGVESPTLLLWGEDDTFGGVEVAERLQGLLSGSELHPLARTGHLPWLDEPVLCGELTSGFLTRQGS